MDNIKQFAKQLIPNRLQVAYCVIVACLLSLYWCRDRLLYVLTASTNTSSQELHASFIHSLDHATNNNLASLLSLALFWALVGLVTLALLRESANAVIAARNDFVIATTYTDTIGFERGLLRTLFVKAGLALGFVLFAVISWKLFGVWYDLIVQPAHVFFHTANVGKELLGFAGLATNIYLGWMWLLYLIPRFFGRLLT